MEKGIYISGDFLRVNLRPGRDGKEYLNLDMMLDNGEDLMSISIDATQKVDFDAVKILSPLVVRAKFNAKYDRLSYVGIVKGAPVAPGAAPVQPVVNVKANPA
jgi:hypothetical protein